MNKKLGFTLVELMGILVILGVLLLMAVPSITRTFQNSKAKEEEEYINSLCAGLQSYMAVGEVTKEYPKTIKIDVLKKAGYVRENIEIPEGSENMSCVSIDTNKVCRLVVSCG